MNYYKNFKFKRAYKPRTKKGNAETPIQNEILEYINYTAGILAIRLNNHAVPVLVYGDGAPKFLGFRKNKWRVLGLPDIMVIILGKVFFIEVKTPEGEQSKEQIQFQADMTARGIDYFVLTSVADTRALFIKKGWAIK